MVSETLIIALTLYLEAASASTEERVLIASVIVNRAQEQQSNYRKVCLAPKQFSCWNGINPGQALKRTTNNNIFRECLTLAHNMHRFQGFSFNHYHDKTIKPPKWTRKATRRLETEKFIFYRI